MDWWTWMFGGGSGNIFLGKWSEGLRKGVTQVTGKEYPMKRECHMQKPWGGISLVC